MHSILREEGVGIPHCSTSALPLAELLVCQVASEQPVVAQPPPPLLRACVRWRWQRLCPAGTPFYATPPPAPHHTVGTGGYWWGGGEAHAQPSTIRSGRQGAASLRLAIYLYITLNSCNIIPSMKVEVFLFKKAPSYA